MGFLSSAYTWAQKAKAVAALVLAFATWAIATLTAHDAALLDRNIPGTSVQIGYALALVVAIASGFITFVTKNAPVLEPQPEGGTPEVGPH